jgi:dolichol-phosphate mannosyltransferase
MNGLRRFGKFNLVGLLGAVLQLLLFSLLIRAGHLSATMAAVIAVEIAIVHNYLWHERFTWRDREPLNLRQRMIRLWRFHAGNGMVSLTGNAALTYAFVEWLGVPTVISAVVAIALCAPANFWLADRWVYAAD